MADVEYLKYVRTYYRHTLLFLNEFHGTSLRKPSVKEYIAQQLITLQRNIFLQCIVS